MGQDSNNSRLPRSRAEALGVTPLKYLIPTQDVSILAGSYSFMLPPVNVTQWGTKGPTLRQVRHSLASKDCYLEPIVAYMKQLVQAEDSIDISDIQFKDPFALNALDGLEVSAEGSIPALDYVSKEIFDGVLRDGNLVVLKKEPVKEVKQCLFDLFEQDSKKLEMVDDRVFDDEEEEGEIPVKKQKLNSDADSHSKIMAENITRKLYIDPKRLKLQALKSLVYLVNMICLGDNKNSDHDARNNISNKIEPYTNDETLLKIEVYLQRIFGGPHYNRDIDFTSEAYNNEIFSSEYLLCIEDLCAKIIKQALSLKWSSMIGNIETTMLKDVLQNIQICKRALHGSSIILTIFLSGRQEQNLYLEDYISPIIELVSCIVESLLLPLYSEAGLTDTLEKPELRILGEELYSLSNLLVQSVHKLDQYINLNDYIAASLRRHVAILNEYLITKLEYMSVLVIFAEVLEENMKFQASSNLVHSLKNFCINLLVSIFRNYGSQRQFILEEVLNNFNIQKLGVNKTQARAFKLTNRSVNVQSFTVLVLRLVQAYDLLSYTFAIPIWKSFIFKSTYQETFNNSIFIADPKTGKVKISSTEKSTLYQEILNYQKHLEAERNSLDLVCVQVTSFMITKFCDNPDATHKNLLEGFLEDLLELLPFPEWSGTESLLFSIMNTLMYVFTSAKYPSVVETFSLEMIGLVGCRILTLKKRNKLEQKNKLVLTSDMTPSSFIELTSYYEYCLQYVRNLSIEDKFFQSNFKFLLFKWFQLLESFKQNLIKEYQLQNSETLAEETKLADELFEELNVIRLQRDAEKKLVNSSSVFKTVNNMYLHYQEELSKKQFGFKNSQRISTYFMEHGENSVITKGSDEVSVISYNYVLSSQRLLGLYDHFLMLVFKSLNHKKIKSRTRAVKNLASVVKRDPSIINNSIIKKVLVDRIRDDSPLVRDATIDLICQYITDHPKASTPFHKAFVERIIDPSIAVQRRVLKLITQVYFNAESDGIRCLLVKNLLKIIHHEDALIIDLAVKNLIEIWFVPVFKEVDRKERNEFVVTAVILEKVHVVTDVLNDDKSRSLYEEFIEKYILFRGNRGINHRKKIDFGLNHDQMKYVLEIYIEKTIDYVIQHNEGWEKVEDIGKIIGLLSALTKCDGSLVSQDQLMLLQPYLTDDYSAKNSICYYTLQIFRNTLPQVTTLRPSFVAETQLSLLKKLTKFNARELNEAMPCVWMLSNMMKDTTKLSNACISCLKLLKQYVNDGGIADSDPKLIRLLYLIGAFGRYCNFEQTRSLFLNAKAGLQEDESVTSILTKYLIIFCKDTINPQVRRVAIRNLINVCVSHAKLFVSSSILKILDKEFAKSANFEVKEVMVQGFIEFLVQEEQDSMKQAGLGISASTNTKLDVNVFHGIYTLKDSDGVCASLVQRYLEKVIKVCLSGNATVSFARFLSISVEHGFANPRLCITTVIALNFSTNEDVSNIAHDLHQELHNKHESLIESRYVEGLRMAALRARFASSNEVKAFSNFYEVISNTRASKRKFIASLSKSFHIEISKCNTSQAQQYNTFIEFIITCLARTHLKTLEECYLLCQNIEHILSKSSITLQYQIEKLSSNSSQELSKWKKLAFLAHGVSCLLEYQKYLCQMYDISPSNFKSFNPSKVEQELRNPAKMKYSGIYLNINIIKSLDSQLDCEALCDSFVNTLYNNSNLDNEQNDDIELVGSESGSETLDYDEEDGQIS